jgi:thiol-disulfide isomerase/thioredoxin
MNWIYPKLLAVLLLLIGAAFFIRASQVQTGPLAGAASDPHAGFQILPTAQQTQLDDFTLTSVDGSKFKLSDALKKGPIVLDFWASYCTPCREELPMLDSIRRRYEAKGIQFYAINAYDNPVAMKAYAAQSGLEIPLVTDTNGAITRSLGVKNIPITAIINSNRKLVTYNIGLDPQMGSDLPSALDKVLQGNT